MEEILEGIATLKSLSQGEKYEVEYEVHFITSMKPATPGGPPVSRTRSLVDKIKTTDGSTIPDGDYELRDGNIYVKLNNTNNVWSVVDSHV